MKRKFSWFYRGGPKNNGYFAYFTAGRMFMGANHRPMTKGARERFLRWIVRDLPRR